MSSFIEYQRLRENEFRLLTLLPSLSTSSLLRVEVFNASLTAPGVPYIALSYTWRTKLDDEDVDAEDSDELVEVDGLVVSLHKNLAVALRCIRTDVPQYVWADALCINQSNVVERSIQVTYMREIFSGATSVSAWLGREARNSNVAMEFLAELARRSQDEDVGEWFDNEALQSAYYPTWEALRGLMTRSWWKRAWIVQEFALPQTVTFLCGERRLSTEEFEAADELLFVHLSTAKHKSVAMLKSQVTINARVFDPARNLLKVRRHLQRKERISALASLQMTRLAHATDPRDHLFAKLGLSDRELTELCPPNYEMDAEDIWFAFLSAYIEQRKDLYITCLAGMQPRKYPHLPSWLPDWGPSKPTYPICSFTHGDKPQWPFFDAANGTEALASISSDYFHPSSTLKSQGILFDTVDGVAGDRWAVQPSVLCQSKFNNNIYKTGLGAFQALCRTVTCNTNRLGDWGPPPREFNAIYAKRWQELDTAIAHYELDPSKELPLPLCTTASGFERTWRSMRDLQFNGEALRTIVRNGLENELLETSALTPLGSGDNVPISASSHPLWTALEHSAGQACFERAIFTTENGYLGLGPATIEPGDKIVILLGCKAPVVLRPPEEQYRLVGEVYLDGIMHGEAMASIQDDPSSEQLRTFEIF